MNKKFVATLLTITTVVVIGTTHTVLGSEQKQASLASGIDRTEIIQEKLNINKNNLQLIHQAKDELNIAEERLDDESLTNANETINNVPSFIRKLFTTAFNELTEKKVAMDEQKRIEEEKELAAAKQAEQEAQVKEEAVQTNNVASSTVTQSKPSSETNTATKKKSTQSGTSSKTPDTKETTASKKSTESTTSSSSNTTDEKSTTKEYSSPTDAKKTGEGKITNEDGSETGRTYEEWTFTVPSDWD